MAIAHVQSAVSTVASDTYTEQVSVTPGAAIGAGNTVVIITGMSGDNLDVGTVTTDKGDTVVELFKHANATDPSDLRVYYIVNAVGGTTQFKYLSSTPEFRLRTLIVREFSGVADVTPLDVAAVMADTDAYGQTYPSGSMTTLNANDVIIGAGAFNNGATTVTSQAGQGWTGLVQANAAPFDVAVSHYKLVTATGAYTSQFESVDYMTGVSAIFALKEQPATTTTTTAAPTTTTTTTAAPTTINRGSMLLTF